MFADPASAIVVAAIEGQELTPEEREFFLEEQPAGVTLFARNIAEPYSRTADLIQELQSLNRNHAPFIVAIDQEGGRVRRIRQNFPDEISMMEIAAGKYDAEALSLISQHAETVGERLREVGVNVNFAPVLDVLTNPDNTAIGDRAFGTEPDVVSRRAAAFLTGMQKTGVWGCLKHFPGQGAANADTHLGPATISGSRAELEACELKPFQAMLDQCPMVMISHSIFPAFEDCPASLSVNLMNYLRQDLGFGGVIVSDDLNMKAIDQSEDAWAQSIIQCVEVGVDMLLVCRGVEKFRLALKALRVKAAASPAFRNRLEEAAKRVSQLRGQLI